MDFYIFALHVSFFQDAVLVVGIAFGVDGEHFAFGYQVEGFADAEDTD